MYEKRIPRRGLIGTTVTAASLKKGYCIGSYQLLEAKKNTCLSCGRSFELVDGCLPLHKKSVEFSDDENAAAGKSAIEPGSADESDIDLMAIERLYDSFEKSQQGVVDDLWASLWDDGRGHSNLLRNFELFDLALDRLAPGISAGGRVCLVTDRLRLELVKLADSVKNSNDGSRFEKVIELIEAAEQVLSDASAESARLIVRDFDEASRKD